MTHHIAYVVHDLGDAAVARRVRMLHAGGALVTVIGFHRRAPPPSAIDGAMVIDLGRTADGRMAQRAWMVLRTLFGIGRLRTATRDCHVLMARNLEMLAIGRMLVDRRRLVYECLDIHRLLLARSVIGRCIRALEDRLMRRVDLIITSSERFISGYFRPRRFTAPILLVENKVLALQGALPRRAPLPAGPPWVIGWFGMLRCRRSLRLLLDMVRSSDGQLEVVLAGVPSAMELGDLDAVIAGVPGVQFLGRYDADDLARLYGRVHFAWAIDYFEEGLNSAWLLPNRLYESMAYGAVPIALGEVETGAWLRRNGVGLIVDIATSDIPAMLAGLSEPGFSALRSAVSGLPRQTITMGPAECLTLVEAIAEGQAKRIAA